MTNINFENSLPQIDWREQYSIGVEIIDSAHKQLFSIVRKLTELIVEDNKGQYACLEGIKFFKNYTIHHFAEEEAYMRSIDYKGYAMHKHLHDELRDETLPKLEIMLEENNYSTDSIKSFLGICIGWLTGHIMIEDRAITGRTASKYEGINPDIVTNLTEALCSITYDIFQVESEIVTNHYVADDSMEMIFYEVVYHCPPAENLHMILCMEKNFILSAIGEMMGYHFSNVGEIIISALSEITNIAISHIGDYLNVSRERYKMESCNFIPLSTVIQKQEEKFPQYSYLFKTSKGHYGVCIDKAIR